MVAKTRKVIAIIVSCLLVLFLGLVLSGCDNSSNNYDITTNSDLNGTIVASSSTAEEGDNIMIAVSPNNGYELNALTAVPMVEFSKVSENVYSFTMPNEDVTIMATFKALAIDEESNNIFVVNSENGSISLSKNTAKANEMIYIVVSPETGYEIDQIISSNNIEINLISENVYSFTMPNEDIIIVATFKEVSQEETIENEIEGSYAISNVVRKYTDGSPAYSPDMNNDDYWKHTYISFDKNNMATIVTYMNYTEPKFYSITTSYTSLGDGQYTVDENFESTYGFSINNIYINNNIVKFELSTSKYTDYYTFTKLVDLEVESGIYNGTYKNAFDESVVVNGATITYNNYTVDYLFGSTAIIIEEDSNFVYIVHVDIRENTIYTSGSRFDILEDTFDSLGNDEFVKVV